MSGPVFRGRFIREIIVPTKAVVQHDCERCKRTWYEDKEAPVAKLIVRMEASDGEKFSGSFDVLCKACEKTVRNSFQAILRDMKKKSSERGKSKAKREGAEPPSTESGPVTTELSGKLLAPPPNAPAQATIPPVAAHRPPPSGPSKRP